MTSARLRVAVVGGSISGCATAIALGRLGHDVHVFERSQGALTGRGAGIGTPPASIKAFRERDMVDADLPCFHAERLAHIGREHASHLGRTAWVTPLGIELLNWGDLYRNLRRRIGGDTYHQGCEVTAAYPHGPVVRLQLAGGEGAEFDLVIFADGYRSLGRRLVSPESPLKYRGYVLWRGVLAEDGIGDAGPMEGTLVRLCHAGGHAVVYLVPGPDSSVAPGRRWINWACYVRVAAEQLSAFLTDRAGRPHAGSLPPGGMRPEQEAGLKRWARDNLPPYYAAVIDASQDTFVQAIYTAEVVRYRQGRIGLAGDAGSFVQPFTGSGVFKGMNNAVDLAAALTSSEDVDAALERWSTGETAAGARLMRLGERLERALIWEVPDFTQMDAESMRTWWTDAGRLPEDLFPQNDPSR